MDTTLILQNNKGMLKWINTTKRDWRHHEKISWKRIVIPVNANIGKPAFQNTVAMAKSTMTGIVIKMSPRN